MATFTGDDGPNTLIGGAGADILDGLGGNDFLQGGAGSDTVRGGSGNDTVAGNDGVDWVQGGAGNDTVSGGSGQDHFLFAEAGAANADTLTDFAGSWDDIRLDLAGLGALGAAGRFASGDVRFFSGAGASAGHDADDRIIFNTTTHQLFYDADGSGGGAAQLIGTLSNGGSVAASDIWVFGTPSGSGTINGTPGDDTLTGTAGNDTINGLGGNDSLVGLEGADSLSGGDGNDTLDGWTSGHFGSGETGVDTLDGGLGNDVFRLDNPADSVSDAGGADTIVAKNMSWTLGAGFENLVINNGELEIAVDGIGNGLDNLLDGRSGNLMTTGGDGWHVRLQGLGGNDTLLGSVQEDTLLGGDGNDSLDAGDGFDILDGGAGDDTLFGGADFEDDTLTGGAGLDHFVLENPQGGFQDRIADFSFDADKLRIDGTMFANAGASGNYSAADGRFYSAAGATSAHDATDRLIYDTTTGDIYYDQDGTGGAAAVLVATLQGAPVVFATDVEVVNGTAGGSSITGGPGDDSLAGTSGNDTIDGQGGNDTIEGEGGSDSLIGGPGDDQIFGGSSVFGDQDPGDHFVGGDGNDTMDGWQSRGSPDADTMNGGLGDDLYVVDRSDDVLTDAGGLDTVRAHDMDWTLAAGFENLILDNQVSESFAAGVGNELDNRMTVLWGGRLEGLGGNDTLLGTDRSETLLGGDGNDSVDGGGGGSRSDVLDGGAGNDTLNAHEGDHIQFTAAPGAANADLVAGFVSGANTLVLDGSAMPAIGAAGDFAASDVRFYAAAGATAGHDANDRVVYDTSTGNLYYDADGSGAGAAQLLATLQGAPALTAADFQVVNGSGSSLNGTPGNDTLTGSAGNDLMNGFGGDDSLDGVGGNDTLDGGAGSDTLTGGTGADAFVVSQFPPDGLPRMTDFASGADKLLVSGATHSNLGASGDFTAGDARFFAAPGATAGHDATDRIVFDSSTGNVYYDSDGAGGAPSELIAVLQPGATLAATDISVEGASASAVFLRGGPGDDTLTGTPGNDTLDGAGGNDSLSGLAGGDSLIGGDGNDTLDGGADVDTLDGGLGNDTYLVTTNDVLADAGGIDTVIAHESWTLADGFENASFVSTDPVVIDGFGNDQANVLDGRAVSVQLGLFGEGGDDEIFGGSSFGILEGGDGNDTVHGGSDFDNIVGEAGDDLLLGGTGQGVFQGGEGDDTMLGGSADDNFFYSQGTLEVGGYGHDSIDGGGGLDFISFNDFGSNTVRSPVTIDLGAGTFSGGDGLDGSAVFQNIEGVNATPFDDRVTGNGIANILRGGAGNDTLTGAGGDDTLTGGGGNDSFVLTDVGSLVTVTDFASGVDKVHFDGAAFSLIGASGNFSADDARFFAGSGAHDADDRVIFDATNGRLLYDADGNGSGFARIVAEATGNVVATDIFVDNGSAGGSGINGTAGDDSLIGTAGDDTINGLQGNDTLVGLGGDDFLHGGPGVDSMDGGAGDDIYYVTTGADVVVDSGGNDTVWSEVSWDLGPDIENLRIVGSAASTSSQGNNLDNRMEGNAGDNYFNPRAGNDSIVGGDGNDTIDMSTGGTSSPGDDTIDGGAGIDTIDYDGYARSAVIVEINHVATGGGDGGVGTAILSGIENAVGGAFDDQLRGDAGDNTLLGRDGNDTLFGGDGNDKLDGGAGNDMVQGDIGNDTITGGAGNDLFVFNFPPGVANAPLITDFASGTDKIQLDGSTMNALGPSGNFSSGDARFFAGAGASAGHDADDRVVYNTSTGQLFYDADGNGASTAQLIATLQSAVALSATDITVTNGSAPPPTGQVINGTSGADSISGGAGNDSIQGGAGNDTILGLGGNDAIGGNDGVDFIEGGTGNDALSGGSGQDHFVFREFGAANADTLSDFASNWDGLSVDNAAFSAVGADGRFTSNDGRFYAAAGASAGHDADDRMVYNTTTGQLYYDADGSGAGGAQLVATIANHPAIAATDITVI